MVSWFSVLSLFPIVTLSVVATGFEESPEKNLVSVSVHSLFSSVTQRCSGYEICGESREMFRAWCDRMCRSGSNLPGGGAAWGLANGIKRAAILDVSSTHRLVLLWTTSSSLHPDYRLLPLLF